MKHGTDSAIGSPRRRFDGGLPGSRALTESLGWRLLGVLHTLRGLGAFALISAGVLVTKLGTARKVVHPVIRTEIARAGVRMLPLFVFVSAMLGLLVIGQAVSWLTRLGAINYLGTIMVVVVVRELGPLLAALLVLARVGTANVIELGTARAMGEVEALEALGIDPVHYMVMPRVLGLGLGMFALTVYLIIGSVVSGYVWAFVQDVPLQPGDYFHQLALALSWVDFVLLALKSLAFGFIIAIVTCYYGLARPLRLEDVSEATVSAAAQSVIGCVVVDALFILIYLST